jgi:hypothetical protein
MAAARKAAANVAIIYQHGVAKRINGQYQPERKYVAGEEREVNS